MCLHVFEGQHGRLFHHVAQVARQCELGALPLAEACLYEENLSAYASPCETCHHAGIVVSLIDVAIERWLAQKPFYGIGRDFLVRQLSVFGLVERQLSEGLVDLLLELSDAAFARVLLNHLLYGGFRELKLALRAETRVLLFLRYQVALGNLYLLFGDVAAHLDNLHAVE